jgi:dihydrolipoamide dehydrogenase
MTTSAKTSTQSADVVLIGGGPGGYVAAIRAAQLGLSTVCVEMDKTLGGTCVNVGCIPSKALLTSSEHFDFARQHAREHGVRLDGVELDLATMLKRKDDVVGQNTRGIEFLFKKNKITWAKGRGALASGNVVSVSAPDGSMSSYQAKNVIIATGSVPVELPFLKFDEERELMPSILPGMDDELVKEADKVFRKQGLDIKTGTRVTSGTRSKGEVSINIEKDGAKETIAGDYVLVSVGRRPSLTGIDAATLGLTLSKRGEVVVDDRMRTNLPNVFAIGDCVPGPMLAHKAEEEGVVAAEVIAGKPAHMHYKSIPGVVYTWPEIASVGLTERQVKEGGREYRAGKFPFSANGRARSMGESSGFVKFISDARTDELLGCHMIGPNVSELIAEIVLAFEYRASADDIGMTVHAHPTLAEVTKEAALATLGRALHI